jgi:hypothetical protein
LSSRDYSLATSNAQALMHKPQTSWGNYPEFKIEGMGTEDRDYPRSPAGEREDNDDNVSIPTIEMLNVYDCDEDLVKTIKEINDDILVYDGTTYFEKKTNRKFTTISMK